MQKIWIIFFLSPLFSFSQDTAPLVPSVTNYSFNWGTSKTQLSIFQYGNRKDIFFINLHSNETTSVEAAKNLLAKNGGTLLQIWNNTERLISFEKNGHHVLFDPNRIFTPTGLKKNLKTLTGHYTATEWATITAFRVFLLSYIPATTKMVIALHNNEDGGLSVLSYTQKGEFHRDAKSTHVNNSLDPDNFFLVTSQQLYNKLTAMNYNVVLQDNVHAEDDGSLSIYLGRKQQNYVNAEAQHGKLAEQQQMLHDALFK